MARILRSLATLLIVALVGSGCAPAQNSNSGTISFRVESGSELGSGSSSLSNANAISSVGTTSGTSLDLGAGEWANYCYFLHVINMNNNPLVNDLSYSHAAPVAEFAGGLGPVAMGRLSTMIDPIYDSEIVLGGLPPEATRFDLLAVAKSELPASVCNSSVDVVRYATQAMIQAAFYADGDLVFTVGGNTINRSQVKLVATRVAQVLPGTETLVSLAATASNPYSLPTYVRPCSTTEQNSGNPLGSGTAARPFRICSAAQLGVLAASDEATELSKTYILPSDLAIATAYPSIGSATYPFTGTFEGAGHKITWTAVSASSNGLFGLMTGKVRELKVALNANVSIGMSTFVGVVAGQNDGIIDRVDVDLGNFTWTNSTSTSGLGGLVGKNTGTIKKSSVRNGSLASPTAASLGGMVAFNMGSVAESFVRNVSVVRGLSTGGFVGDQAGGLISDSYYKCEAPLSNGYLPTHIVQGASGVYIGGFVGQVSAGSIARVAALARVKPWSGSLNIPSGGVAEHAISGPYSPGVISDAIVLYRSVYGSVDTSYSTGPFGAAMLESSAASVSAINVSMGNSQKWKLADIGAGQELVLNWEN